MKANPGGKVAPQDLVGRDQFIDSLWDTLERLGVVLVAERRTGKTSIIEKMIAEPRPGFLVFSSDVQGVSTPLELVEKLMRDAYSKLSGTRKARNRLEKLWSSLGGTQIAGIFSLPAAKGREPKVLLERLLDDLAEGHPKERVVVAWDELPWALQKISKTERPFAVVELLDVLRAARQKHPNLRMIFTGSIGLHHVVSGLHDDGFANSATNDMRTLLLPPLEDVDARSLASTLLRGEGFSGEEVEETAEFIASRVGGIPFYIHGLVAGLKEAGLPATPAGAAEALDRELTSVEDRWDLDHFRDRLKDYYGPRAELAGAILDLLAEHEALSLEEIVDHLETRPQPLGDETKSFLEGGPQEMRSLLKLMQRDHYLGLEGRSYRFLHDLIRRWWRFEQGLA